MLQIPVSKFLCDLCTILGVGIVMLSSFLIYERDQSSNMLLTCKVCDIRDNSLGFGIAGIIYGLILMISSMYVRPHNFFQFNQFNSHSSACEVTILIFFASICLSPFAISANVAFWSNESMTEVVDNNGTLPYCVPVFHYIEGMETCDPVQFRALFSLLLVLCLLLDAIGLLVFVAFTTCCVQLTGFLLREGCKSICNICSNSCKSFQEDGTPLLV